MQYTTRTCCSLGLRARSLATALMLALALTAIADAAAGDSIVLRGSVRLDSDAEHVLLADIAELQGEQVHALADLVIAPAPLPGEALELSVREVRAALDAAQVHWGRTHLNGRRVVVRPGRSDQDRRPLAMAPLAITGAQEQERAAPPEPHARLAAELISGGDLRSAAAAFMAEALKVKPEKLRLAFDQRDEALLATELASNRFEIEPLSSMQSARAELAIRGWEGDRIVLRETISVAPSVKVPIVVLKQDVGRGDVLSSDDLAVQEQWHPASAVEGRLVQDLEGVIGRTTATRLREGDVLRPSHLHRETLVRRGELVTVRCIVGGAVISLQAEARANATDGEIIEFRKPGERETFLATVTGRGSAVLNLARRRSE